MGIVKKQLLKTWKDPKAAAAVKAAKGAAKGGKGASKGGSKGSRGGWEKSSNSWSGSSNSWSSSSGGTSGKGFGKSGKGTGGKGGKGGKGKGKNGFNDVEVTDEDLALFGELTAVPWHELKVNTIKELEDGIQNAQSMTASTERKKLSKQELKTVSNKAEDIAREFLDKFFAEEEGRTNYEELSAKFEKAISEDEEQRWFQKMAREVGKNGEGRIVWNNFTYIGVGIGEGGNVFYIIIKLYMYNTSKTQSDKISNLLPGNFIRSFCCTNRKNQNVSIFFRLKP